MASASKMSYPTFAHGVSDRSCDFIGVVVVRSDASGKYRIC